MARFPRWSFLLPLCLLLSACGTLAATNAEQQLLAETATASPRLQSGEKIRVTVYNEPTLSGEYQIDPSGYIALPLAGTAKAAGLTQSELEQELEKKFSNKYLKNPKVTVSVIQFRPFYIVGEIEKPGSYAYTSGINVLSAIAIAGGTTYRASRSTVLIQHPGDKNLREYPMEASIPIMPGDIVKVPQRYF